MDNKNELFPLVNEDGQVLGSITRGKAHDGSKLLHPVVHLHLFNSHGQLYLQKRPEWKDIQPGKWDTACGGHIDYGETVEAALSREVREELGVTSFKPLLLFSLCPYCLKCCIFTGGFKPRKHHFRVFALKVGREDVLSDVCRNLLA